MSEKERKPRVANGELSWPSIKAHYIKENLSPGAEGPMTFAALAKIYGVAPGTVRNRAAAEDWTGQLKAEREKMSAGTIEKARVTIEWNEAEIRTRQWKIARLALAKATAALQALDSTKLTHREMIDLLNLGLTEERKAAGIADKHVFQHELLTQEQAAEEQALRSAVGIMSRLSQSIGVAVPAELQNLAAELEAERPAIEHNPDGYAPAGSPDPNF